MYNHCCQYLQIHIHAVSSLQKVVLHYVYYVCMYIPRCVHIAHIATCVFVCSKCMGNLPPGCVLVSLPLRCGRILLWCDFRGGHQCRLSRVGQVGQVGHGPPNDLW